MNVCNQLTLNLVEQGSSFDSLVPSGKRITILDFSSSSLPRYFIQSSPSSSP